MQAPASILQAGASFAIAAALIAYVVGHRPHAALHRTVIGILGTILLWNAGMLLRLGGGPDTLVAFAFCVQFAGVYGLPPLFLYLTARFTRLPIAEERPSAVLAALLVPSSLAYLSLLTNPLHGLFSRLPLVEAAFAKPPAWAGPYFWLSGGWSSLCAQIGIALCLYAAWRTSDRLDRKRLLVIAAAATAPVVSTAVWMIGWLSVTVTPAALAVTGMCIVWVIVRYRLLEFAPLPARDVIERLREGLVLADGAGRVTEVNPAAEAMLRRRAADLRGEMLAALATGLDASGEFTAAINDCAVDATVVRVLESPDGRAIEASCGWVRSRDGSPIGRFLVFNDRTEQQRHERLRDQAERLASVAALAAGLAHEINNPLAYVRASLSELHRIADVVEGCAERLGGKEAAELTEMRELVEDSLEGVARITSIVASTRRLTRDSADRRVPVDLNAIAEDALQFASFHENHSVVVESALERNLPTLDASPDRLGQVALNLLINAKQVLEGRAEGRILVETLRCNDSVELRVHDNGPGVDSELRERIFDPFFTTKAPDQGTGLGLAIAYDIVRAHGGVIEVVDSPLGGACFRVRLPVR
jgi:signal transduction histidine kinase